MFKTIDYVQKYMTVGLDPPSTDTNKQSGKLNVKITKTNDDFNPTQAQIQERVKYIKRGHESALMNDTTKSSIVIRHDGQINVSSNRYAQYKLNPSGKIIESSLESISLSNRRKVQTDDMILNEHKLNPYLYELTDIKKLTSAYNDDMMVGNFCLFGSVLTRTWEMNLKRYVLMRRPARMPMFSTVLNVPEINTGLGITDPLKIDEDLLVKSTKGYQVHDVVSDANSLIGKEGRARAGSRSDNIISYSDGSSSGTQTSQGSVPSSSGGTINLQGNSNAEIVWNFLKSEGFTDEGAAAVLGNFLAESGCEPAKAEGIYDRKVYEIPPTGGYGLAQWTSEDRVAGLERKAAQMGKPVHDMSVQLAWFREECISYGTWDKVKKATDIDSATYLFEQEYEGAGVKRYEVRISEAHNAYNSFAKKSS